MASRTISVGEVAAIIEDWAPKDIAWEGDNVGLLVGGPHAPVRGIMVSLDVTPGIISEALRKKANLMISHHPLPFRPLRSFTDNSGTTESLRMLIKGEMNLYAAHTNLDFTREGTSFVLADTLNLENLDFLQKPYMVQKKIVTFVPSEHVDRVSEAMAGAGAGRIGSYDNCSFRIEGKGTFRGGRDSHPAVGKKGNFEQVQEVRLEMVADQWQVAGVVEAMKKSHPYEEVAYEVYPTENKSRDYGIGVVGTLKRSISLRTFLAALKRALRVSTVRCTGKLNTFVRSVAVCGGSGSDFLEEAISRGADVFVTADVKYHTFHQAAGRIALVDAGHYETELPVVRALVNRLKSELGKRRTEIPVFATKTSTNPIMYV